MPDLVGIVATLAASLFAGAAIYINLVEHPARLACGTELAARQFAPSYKRATVMQVSLALVATLAGLGQWLSGAGIAWLAGALLIFAVIPFTLIVTFSRSAEPASSTSLVNAASMRNGTSGIGIYFEGEAGFTAVRD